MATDVSEASPTVPTAPPPATSWAPRIVLLRRDQPRRGGAVSPARPDPEGWQRALSRGARRRRRRAARHPRRAVPADLVGRCFNCFSSSHTAGLCRQKTRCFRCRSQGHRSYVCPLHRPAPARASVWRRVSPSSCAVPLQRSPPAGVVDGAPRRAPARVSVWRRVSPATDTASAAPTRRPPLTGVAGGAGTVQGPMEVHGQSHGAGAGQQRRRRRPRREQRQVQEAGSSAVAAPLPGLISSDTSQEDSRHPPCIIDWSDQVTRAEEELAYVVVVYVICDGPLAAAGEVAEVIATRLEVVASSLVLRQASASSYLLFLPDLAMVERLVGLQHPIRSSGVNFSLLCKRWSRLSGGESRVLPILLDIELRDIPNHVWETSTVDRLLSPHAWVQQVHPDTLGLVDLSCFRCLAWSTDPSTLPSSRELWVAEPPTAALEDPPVKRVLAYHINIRYSVALHPRAPDPPSDGGVTMTTLQDGGNVFVPLLLCPARVRRTGLLSTMAAVLVG